MSIFDRIHCDHIINHCTKERIRKEKKKKKIPFQMKMLKKKFNYLLNYKKDPIDIRDYLFKTSASVVNLLETNATLPSKVDHTSMMTSVKDQGELGSCVGFAVSAMKEYQEKVENIAEIDAGKKGSRNKTYDYSEAWIYWNAKQIDEWPGEEGTDIRSALKVLNKIGVPTENGWPYIDEGDFGQPKKWANLVARWALIGSYWRVETLGELKIALNDGPVPIAIPCFYEIFFVDSSGYVPYPYNPYEYYGGHAICAVGYDDARRLVKFKNSWGRYWGDNGYGYLPYSYVRDFLWDAWACKDINVSREMLKGEYTLI